MAGPLEPVRPPLRIRLPFRYPALSVVNLPPMPKTQRELAREVKQILAGIHRTPLQHATIDRTRGTAAFRNIQGESRLVENEVRAADNASAVAAQQGPRSAHDLVATSLQHAAMAKRIVEQARAWGREAQGTPELPAVERILAGMQHAAARAKAHAANTKRAFEKHFGKYDPRGVTDLNEAPRRKV